jgi:hypothetical protein
MNIFFIIYGILIKPAAPVTKIFIHIISIIQYPITTHIVYTIFSLVPSI